MSFLERPEYLDTKEATSRDVIQSFMSKVDADADSEIMKWCDYVAPHHGGAGAVRDFIHEILGNGDFGIRLLSKSIK